MFARLLTGSDDSEKGVDEILLVDGINPYRTPNLESPAATAPTHRRTRHQLVLQVVLLLENPSQRRKGEGLAAGALVDMSQLAGGAFANFLRGVDSDEYPDVKVDAHGQEGDDVAAVPVGLKVWSLTRFHSRKPRLTWKSILFFAPT